MFSQLAYSGYYNRNYGYYNYNPADNIAFGGGFLFAVFFISAIAHLASSIGYYFIFKKAGIKPYYAFIPVLNNWKLLELGGIEGWKSLLAFIPYVGPIAFLVFYVKSTTEISKKLGGNPALSIIAVIVPPLWVAILCLSGKPWNDAAGTPSLAEGTILGYEVVSDDEDEAKEETEESAEEIVETEEKVEEPTKTESEEKSEE